MRCTTTRTIPFQLHCIFPENVGEINDLSVQFNPDNGPQRLVVACTLQDELECYQENGFTSSLKDSTRAEITLPDNFIHESGNFSCQIPGLSIDEITSCRWPPQENGTRFIPEPTQSGNEETSFPFDYKPSPSEDGGTNGMVVGVALGVVLFITIFAIVFLVLFKKNPAFRRWLTCLGPERERSKRDNNVVVDERNNPPNSNDQQEQEKITVNKSEQTICTPDGQAADYSSNEPLLSSDESLIVAPKEIK